MKIVLDARYLDGTYSGIATYSRHVLENLSEVDTENDYVVIVRPGLKEPLRLGENFKIVAWRPPPVSMRTLLTLGRYIDSLNADLMHSFFPLAPIRLKTPLIVTVHDMQPFVDPDFSSKRLRMLQMAFGLFYRVSYPSSMNKARWILSDSYATKNDVLYFFPQFAPKMVVLPLGLDESFQEPIPEGAIENLQVRMGLKRPYFLYYGSTRPNKNIPAAIKAFEKASKRPRALEADFVLVLRKDRFFKDIRRAINQSSIAERIRVYDPMSHSEQRVLLAGAYALLFPTKYEGFGFPPLEAMASGTPVIAGESGSLPEICGRAAEIVDPDDVESIAQGIFRMMTNEERRQRLIERGRERAKNYDWQETARFLKNFYELLI